MRHLLLILAAGFALCSCELEKPEENDQETLRQKLHQTLDPKEPAIEAPSSSRPDSASMDMDADTLQ